MALVMGSTCRADSGGGRSGRGGTREVKQILFGCAAEVIMLLFKYTSSRTSW